MTFLALHGRPEPVYSMEHRRRRLALDTLRLRPLQLTRPNAWRDFMTVEQSAAQQALTAYVAANRIKLIGEGAAELQVMGGLVRDTVGERSADAERVFRRIARLAPTCRVMPCACCGAPAVRARLASTVNGPVCAPCLDLQYVRAVDTGNMIDRDEAFMSDGDCYEEDPDDRSEVDGLQAYHCHPHRDRKLRRHSSRPEDSQVSETSPILIGVEWELECDERDRKAAGVDSTTFALAEEDGSLDDDRGMEVITGYSTIDTVSRWLQKIHEICRPDGNEGCGLHVNVSGLSQKACAHLTYFLNNWKPFQEPIFGRWDVSYAKLVTVLTMDQAVYQASVDDNKYRHVQVRSQHSDERRYAEIRVFKGTSTLGICQARVQYAYALCEYIRATEALEGVDHLTPPAFLRWLADTPAVAGRVPQMYQQYGPRIEQTLPLQVRRGAAGIVESRVINRFEDLTGAERSAGVGGADSGCDCGDCNAQRVAHYQRLGAAGVRPPELVQRVVLVPLSSATPDLETLEEGEGMVITAATGPAEVLQMIAESMEAVTATDVMVNSLMGLLAETPRLPGTSRSATWSGPLLQQASRIHRGGFDTAAARRNLERNYSISELDYSNLELRAQAFSASRRPGSSDPAPEDPWRLTSLAFDSMAAEHPPERRIAWPFEVAPAPEEVTALSQLVAEFEAEDAAEEAEAEEEAMHLATIGSPTRRRLRREQPPQAITRRR